MPNETLDPQQEKGTPDHAGDDELEKLHDLPSAKRKDPVSADDLQQHYDMPSRSGYDDAGDEPSSPAGKTAKAKPSAKPGGDKSFYTPGQTAAPGSGLSRFRPSFKGALRFAGRNRLKLALAGAAAAIVTIVIVGILVLIPLKILHIVNNLQSHFYSSSENAVQKETDKLFSKYIKKSLRSCGGTIDKNCNPFTTANPIERLYKGWRTAKFEDELSSKYGLEFKKVGSKYYMKAPGLTGDGADITSFVNDDSGMTLDEYIAKQGGGEWVNINRSQIRQYVRDSVSGETLWKRVLYRYKIGRYLEEKFGIRRCIILCKLTDPLADAVQAQKDAAKLYLVDRVVAPMNATVAEALKCFLDPACDPTDTKPNPEPTDTPGTEMDGQPLSDTEMAIQSDLLELNATKYGAEGAAELEASADEVKKLGLQESVIKAIWQKWFNKNLTDEEAKSISSKLNAITWLNMAAHIVTGLDNAPQKLKKLSYLTKIVPAISLYAMYRTYADETKSGKVTGAEVGSFVSSLDTFSDFSNYSGDSNTQDQKGGNAEAEQTPLYSSLMGDGTASGSSDYLCDDGKSPPSGEVICPEEKLATDSSFFNSSKGILDSSMPGCGCSINQLAKAWNESIGKVIGVVGDIIGWIAKPFIATIQWTADLGCHKIFGYYPPGDPYVPYCEVRSLISSAAQSLMGFLTSKLFPSPFSENMSGGRTFDMMAAGADASGNDYAHYGLGGEVLTDSQAADIRNQQALEDKQQYDSEPFFARMFDTSSNYSPITKLAMALPSNKESAVQSIAMFFTNPFQKMGSAFGSIFSVGHAFAAEPAQSDPFGVTQYGYPNGPLIIPSGPLKGQDFWNIDDEEYWNDYCADGSLTNQWNQQAASPNNIDPNTGMPMNTTFNGCALIQATTGSDGAMDNPSLLTQDDLADQ